METTVITELDDKKRKSFSFPVQSSIQHDGFTRFLEDSGTANILFELFSNLYGENDKPEDPISWIRNYLRQKAPPRPLHLTSTIQTLQQEILKTANEIEEIKSLIQGEKFEERNNNGMEFDKDFLNNDNACWQIKPDPFYRPTFKLTPIMTKMATRPSEDAKLSHSLDKVNVLRNIWMSSVNSNPLEDGRTTFDHGVTKEEPKQDIKNEEIKGNPAEKSTETSQVSMTTLTSKTLKEKVEKFSRPKFIVTDPTYFSERIPEDFWTEDFTTTKKVKSDKEKEDEKEWSAKKVIRQNYKFNIMNETSWLLERDVFFRNLKKFINKETPSDRTAPPASNVSQ